MEHHKKLSATSTEDDVRCAANLLRQALRHFYLHYFGDHSKCRNEDDCRSDPDALREMLWACYNQRE